MKRIISFSVFIFLSFFISAAQAQTKHAPKAPKIKIEADSTFFPHISNDDEVRIINNFSPEVKKALEKIKKLNKLKYMSLLFENSFNFPDFPNVPGFTHEDSEEIKLEKENRQKVKELEILTESLGMRIQTEKDANRNALKEELKGKLGDLFELREQNKSREVKSLEKRLNELRSSLEERRKNKDEIVRRRLMDLIGENDNTEW